MLKPAKAFFPKYRGISQNGFAESANPFRAFRGGIFITANFTSLPEAAQSASIFSDRSFSLLRTALRTAPASVLYAYGVGYPFLSLTLLSATSGRANFRPQAAWGSGAFAPASSKNVHFCDACPFLSLRRLLFSSQPPDNIV